MNQTSKPQTKVPAIIIITTLHTLNFPLSFSSSRAISVAGDSMSSSSTQMQQSALQRPFLQQSILQ